MNNIPGIEEVNMIKDDGTVIHFNNPKVSREKIFSQVLEKPFKRKDLKFKKILSKLNKE